MAMADSPIKSLKLKHPIQQGSETVSELCIMKRPRARHFKGIPAQNILFDHMLVLLGKITGQPPSVIEELDSEDLIPAINMVNDFLPSSLTTGESR
jgi:hypothetical protein